MPKNDTMPLDEDPVNVPLSKVTVGAARGPISGAQATMATKSNGIRKEIIFESWQRTHNTLLSDLSAFKARDTFQSWLLVEACLMPSGVRICARNCPHP